MAAVFRQPLAPRSMAHIPPTHNPQQPAKAYPPSLLKRPRSPEPLGISAAHDNAITKRHRTQSANAKENVDKQMRKAEREARESDFRAKYTKAFPSWTFFFDTTDAERNALVPRIVQLNGVRRLSSNHDSRLTC
jgi:regulatory subunit for Cdc7p protein kinase